VAGKYQTYPVTDSYPIAHVMRLTIYANQGPWESCGEWTWVQ